MTGLESLARGHPTSGSEFVPMSTIPHRRPTIIEFAERNVKDPTTLSTERRD